MDYRRFNCQKIKSSIEMKTENDLQYININGRLYKTRPGKILLNRKSYTPVDDREIKSFIPGTILDILVIKGQQVSKGDDLLILNAMKMQNRLKSGIDGKIKEINVSRGEKVSKGKVLIVLE